MAQNSAAQRPAPLRAQGGEQTAGQRQIVQRQSGEPIHSSARKQTAVWPALRAPQSPPRLAASQSSPPATRSACRSDDVPASRRPAQKNALPLAQPQHALPICAASKTFSRRPRLASFFHAQHAEGPDASARRKRRPIRAACAASAAAVFPRVIARQIQRRRAACIPQTAQGENARIQQPCQRPALAAAAGARPREHNAKPHFFALLPVFHRDNLCVSHAKTRKKSRVGGKNS